MSRSWPILLTLLAVHLTSGPSPAWADGGDPSLIHACATPVVRGSGAFLRIIGASDTCPPGQTPVHWPGSIGDDPPPPAAPRFVIRDANGAEFGTFGGFQSSTQAWAHFTVGDRSFVLGVAADRLSGPSSRVLYVGSDTCEGTPYLQAFPGTLKPLQPLSGPFVRTDVGSPFEVFIVADLTEAPQARGVTSSRETNGSCDTTDFPGTASVTATAVTLSPVLPLTIGLE